DTQVPQYFRVPGIFQAQFQEYCEGGQLVTDVVARDLVQEIHLFIYQQQRIFHLFAVADISCGDPGPDTCTLEEDGCEREECMEPAAIGPEQRIFDTAQALPVLQRPGKILPCPLPIPGCDPVEECQGLSISFSGNAKEGLGCIIGIGRSPPGIQLNEDHRQLFSALPEPLLALYEFCLA